MPIVPSRVKPSQFYDSQHGEVADVEDYQGEDTGVEHGDCEQVPECTARVDQVNHQDRLEVEDVDRGVADQQPVVRSKRNRTHVTQRCMTLIQSKLGGA